MLKESRPEGYPLLRLGPLLAYVVIVGLVIGGIIAGAVSQLHRAPEHSVEAWLHVTDADIARETIYTQVLVVVVILIGVALTVLLAVRRRFDRAAAVLLLSVVEAAFFWLLFPSFALGSRDAAPLPLDPGMHATLTPVPFPTDFDYHAHLPALWSAVTTPALWSAAAAVPLGLVLATVGPSWAKLSRRLANAGSGS